MKHFSKVIIPLVLLISLCVCVTGCAGRMQEEIPGTPVSSVESSASHIQSSEDSAPEETKPEEIVPAPAEPLDISTSGGVVIVGTVCCDEEGWFLTPEQPMNIEYHYFLDNPSRFDALLRIELFDSGIDGSKNYSIWGKLLQLRALSAFIGIPLTSFICSLTRYTWGKPCRKAMLRQSWKHQM